MATLHDLNQPEEGTALRGVDFARIIREAYEGNDPLPVERWQQAYVVDEFGTRWQAPRTQLHIGAPQPDRLREYGQVARYYGPPLTQGQFEAVQRLFDGFVRAIERGDLVGVRDFRLAQGNPMDWRDPLMTENVIGWRLRAR